MSRFDLAGALPLYEGQAFLINYEKSGKITLEKEGGICYTHGVVVRSLSLRERSRIMGKNLKGKECESSNALHFTNSFEPTNRTNGQLGIRSILIAGCEYSNVEGMRSCVPLLWKKAYQMLRCYSDIAVFRSFPNS